jgi:hypothetical protein
MAGECSEADFSFQVLDGQRRDFSGRGKVFPIAGTQIDGYLAALNYQNCKNNIDILGHKGKKCAIC